MNTRHRRIIYINVPLLGPVCAEYMNRTTRQVPYTKDGLEAIIFTADGDLRQAVNSLQSTASGFDLVDQTTVLKVRPAACMHQCLFVNIHVYVRTYDLSLCICLYIYTSILCISMKCTCRYE
jgi:hypothetical protein